MDQNHISYNSIFILFLMIITNYLSEVIPKSIRKYFSENIVVKHIFSFLVLFFFIMIVSPERKFLPYSKLFKDGILIYLIFFIACISKGIYFFIIIIICFILYIIHLKEDSIIYISNNKSITDKHIDNYNSYRSPQRMKITSIIKKTLIVLLYIIVIIGIIHNFYDKKLKFKNKFNFWKFILNN